MASIPVDRKPRLLVVDDDPSTRATYARILSLEGYDVATADDGAQALSLLRSASFDLVLTDHRMPSVTGLELIAEATTLSSSVRVIMYTALGSPALERAARRLGAVDYSDRLWDVDGLRATVKRHLNPETVSLTASTAILHSADPRIRRALTFIRRGCRSRQLSRERTAKVTGVSPGYLDKLLCETTHTTFTQHRRLARVAAASHLISSTRLLMKQIAVLVGYPNDGALRRDFRLVFGRAPALHRRINFDRK